MACPPPLLPNRPRGLVYVPANFATTEEVVELAKVAARHGGIYVSHLRNEGKGLLESVAELIRVAREAGLPAQINHQKAVGATQWGWSERTLAMIDSARALGLDVKHDLYGGDLARVQFRTVASMPQYDGKTLADLAAGRGLPNAVESGIQLAIQLQLDGGFSAIYHAMDEGYVIRAGALTGARPGRVLRGPARPRPRE